MSDDQDQVDWAVESDDPAREEGKPWPPPDWKADSCFDRVEIDWWIRGPGGTWRRDPCPVKPLGHLGGQFYLVTAAGELRSFTSGQLHGRGGAADLFGGDLRWPMRHFRTADGGLHVGKCMAALIRACHLSGYYDGTVPHRSVGTWRAADGRPIVHAGDRIFAPDPPGGADPQGGTVHDPGLLLDDALYVIGGTRQAPRYRNGRGGRFEWEPAALADCHRVAGHLDEWHWIDEEARDLFLGGLACDMLGDALRWKPHKFVRAPAGSGKSTLLRYARALLGGAAHPIQKTYSKPYLEQHFGHTACALLLDEMESARGEDRVRKLWDLVLLLSDEGATGGRGTSGGIARTIDLHGAVTMIATLTDDWKQTIRSRVVMLELRPFRDRPDHPPAPEETIVGMIDQAAELSPGIRARALARFDLFQANLARVRARILELGGSPRDADQLGHLIAGWATMTADAPIDDDTVGRLDRFKPFILTVMDQEDGEDDASRLWNTLLGLPTRFVRSSLPLTVGQLIARARDPDDEASRKALLPHGLRLERLKSQLNGQWEPWDRAWLAIANNHPGLDQVLEDYPEYQGRKRAQILGDLRHVIVRGEQQEILKPIVSEIPLRFAGPQSRALLLPPELLPSLADERGFDAPARAKEIPD